MILMTKGSFIKVENIAECSLNTFDLHLAIVSLENQCLVCFESGRFTQVLLETNWLEHLYFRIEPIVKYSSIRISIVATTVTSRTY